MRRSGRIEGVVERGGLERGGRVIEWSRSRVGEEGREANRGE